MSPLAEQLIDYITETQAKFHYETTVSISPTNAAFSLKCSEGDVYAALTELEAAGKISRIGKAMKIPVEGGEIFAFKVKLLLSGAERVKRFRAAQKAKGLKQMSIWVTPEEEEAVKAFLADLREKGPSLF